MDTIPVMRYPILGAALLLTIVLGCDRQETVVVRKVVTTTAPANGKPATLPLRPQTAPTDGHYREKTRPVVDALQQVSSDFQAEVDDEIAAAHFAAADVAFQRWAEELTRSEEAMESCKKLRSVHAGFRESISAAREAKVQNAESIRVPGYDDKAKAIEATYAAKKRSINAAADAATALVDARELLKAGK
jgi:hypothetical protein